MSYFDLYIAFLDRYTIDQASASVDLSTLYQYLKIKTSQNAPYEPTEGMQLLIDKYLAP